MDLFETILFNAVCIMFPILLYLFYLAYQKNVGKEENKLFLNFAFISSFYLVTRVHINFHPELVYLILHIPLFMAYRYREKFSIILLSLMLCLYGSVLFHITPIYFVIEYLSYAIMIFYFQKKRWSSYITMQAFLGLCAIHFIIIFNIKPFPTDTMWMNVFMLVCYIVAYAFATYFTIYLFEKGEQILKYHMTVKELEHEKQIRMSLFKITHEIKNPIAVCKGYLDMFDVNKSEHSKKYVPILREEIDRTLILLQDFLSMTKIKIEKDVLDINLLLEEVTDSFLPILKEKKITPRFTIPKDEVYVNGDYHRLSQVMVNMIKNSIEAMEEGGKLTVSSKVIGSNRVQIEVIDCGSGISEDDLKKMTEPFFTTKKDGTGLGVSLSNEIILAHGGSLKYRSKEGKGTTVSILLDKMDA